jgi:hypothetical protein
VNSLEQSIVTEHVDLQALARIHNGNTVIDDFKNGLQDWAVREGGRLIRTYKFQSPDVDRSNGKKLLLRIDPRDRKLSLRLSASSRFLSSELNQGSFSTSRSVEGNGPQDVVIDRNDFKAGGNGKAGQVLEWSRITRFDLSVLDLATKQKIDLTSKEGLSMLKLISWVDEQASSLSK